MTGHNRDLETQKRLLLDILSQNPALLEIMQNAPTLGLANYYIGAGCICQTVWNFQNGLDCLHGISDIDFVYFDDDLSYEKEDRVIRQIDQRFSELPVRIDVKNQARVHLWYKEYYGYDLQPYASVEDAINTWPTTATAVGVRMQEGEFVVYAPFGLNDMFGQIVRPNKTQITAETYRSKCEKWRTRWPALEFIEW